MLHRGVRAGKVGGGGQLKLVYRLYRVVRAGKVGGGGVDEVG